MQLLVSVTNLDEIETALAGGADILDLKSPTEGSLGAAPPSLIREARERVPAGVPVSAALGDFPPLPNSAALAAVGAALAGAEYVKIGILGSRAAAIGTAGAVRSALASFAPNTRLVLATYADGAGAALPVDTLPTVAAEAGASGCLIDTLYKDGRSLRSHLSLDQLGAFVEQCHHHGMTAALAGALGADDLPLLAQLGADLVGVRGAACRGGRGGHLDPALVRALKECLHD